MKVKDIIKEIGNLELSENLLLVEDIWDAKAQGNNELPLPEWQKKELQKRFSDFQNGKTTLHDWKGVHEDLRDK